MKQRNLRFEFTTARTSFNIDLLPGKTKVNYPGMPDGKYDQFEDEVYDNLVFVKGVARQWIKDTRMTSSERYWLRDQLTELTLDDLVNEVISDRDALDQKWTAFVKSGFDISLEAFAYVVNQWTGGDFHDKFMEPHFGHEFKSNDGQLNEYALEKFRMFRDRTARFLTWLDHSGRRSFSGAVNSYWMEYKASHPEVA